MWNVTDWPSERAANGSKGEGLHTGDKKDFKTDTVSPRERQNGLGWPRLICFEWSLFD